jgi:uncharacterized protein YrrD
MTSIRCYWPVLSLALLLIISSVLMQTTKEQPSSPSFCPCDQKHDNTTTCGHILGPKCKPNGVYFCAKLLAISTFECQQGVCADDLRDEIDHPYCKYTK